MCDPVKIVIIKFQNHPNILAFKHSVSIEEVFDFSCGETNDILKEIDSLDTKNVCFSKHLCNCLKDM